MQRARILSPAVIGWGNTLVACSLATYFLLIPGFLVLRNLRDPALMRGEIPREAWRLHRYLAPRYASWARERINSGIAADVYYLDVPGTEWPLFGSVFFLWSTEYLQRAWEQDPGQSPVSPAVYAGETVEACKDLLLDPAHHAWVQTHWGDDYMHRENVFFRSLLIAGLTSYEALTGSGDTINLLKDQVSTLSRALDESPHGVLYDYPGECYPIDVFAAIAWIRRADVVLGTDHSDFVHRAQRAFSGSGLDRKGLIPWQVNPRTGEQYEASRGIVNSHVLIFAPEIYTAEAAGWYEKFEAEFWQEKWFGSGFREYYRDRAGGNWTYDVDAGPIIGGFSPSANAFGIAAAYANGRPDQAQTLTTQVLTACWPLPDGRLLGPRILSDSDNAPYLGECAILWQLTEGRGGHSETAARGTVAGSVYIGFVFYFGLGGFILIFSYVILHGRRRKLRKGAQEIVPHQGVLWIVLLALGVIFFSMSKPIMGIVCLLPAQFLPVLVRSRSHTL
jgi:hypothetical protein